MNCIDCNIIGDVIATVFSFGWVIYSGVYMSLNSASNSKKSPPCL